MHLQKKNNLITQPLQICIGPSIRIGRESWCLPYTFFFLGNLQKSVNTTTYIRRPWTLKANTAYERPLNLLKFADNNTNTTVLNNCSLQCYWLLHSHNLPFYFNMEHA